MKILILQDNFPPDDTGGAAKISFNATIGLASQHDVVVLSASSNPEKLEKEHTDQPYQLKVFYSQNKIRKSWFRTFFSISGIKATMKIYNDTRPDIIFVHNIHSHISFTSLFLLTLKKKPIYFFAHDVISLLPFKFFYNLSNHRRSKYKISIRQSLKSLIKTKNPLYFVVNRAILNRCNAVVAVSEDLRNFFHDNGIKNAHFIHNGISLSQTKMTDQDILKFKKKFGLVNFKIITFAGRVEPAKGIYQFLEAAEVLMQDYENFRFMVIGEDKLELISNYCNKNRLYSVKSSLVTTGWIHGEELTKAYLASDVIVVPSRYLDPFPTVVLEAMAHKKAVVVSRLGGANEAIENKKNGELIDVYSVESIVEGVKNSAQYSDLYGEYGYKRFHRYFSLQSYIDNIHTKIIIGKL